MWSFRHYCPSWAPSRSRRIPLVTAPSRPRQPFHHVKLITIPHLLPADFSRGAVRTVNSGFNVFVECRNVDLRISCWDASRRFRDECWAEAIDLGETSHRFVQFTPWNLRHVRHRNVSMIDFVVSLKKIDLIYFFFHPSWLWAFFCNVDAVVKGMRNGNLEDIFHVICLLLVISHSTPMFVTFYVSQMIFTRTDFASQKTVPMVIFYLLLPERMIFGNRLVKRRHVTCALRIISNFCLLTSTCCGGLIADEVLSFCSFATFSCSFAQPK